MGDKIAVCRKSKTVKGVYSIYYSTSNCKYFFFSLRLSVTHRPALNQLQPLFFFSCAQFKLLTTFELKQNGCQTLFFAVQILPTRCPRYPVVNPRLPHLVFRSQNWRGLPSAHIHHHHIDIHASSAPEWVYAPFLFCLPYLRANFFVISRSTRFSYIKTARPQRGVIGARRGLCPTRWCSCFDYIDISRQDKDLPVPPCLQRVLPGWSYVLPLDQNRWVQSNYLV